MFMSRNLALDEGIIDEDPGLDIRGSGSDIHARKEKSEERMAKEKQFAVRPVSARSYNNAMAEDSRERPASARGVRPFSPMDRKDSLEGTVTTYSNDLFGDEIEEERASASSSRSPRSKIEAEKAQRLQQQKQMAAQKRRERSLSIGMVVSNDSMMLRPSSARSLSTINNCRIPPLASSLQRSMSLGTQPNLNDIQPTHHQLQSRGLPESLRSQQMSYHPSIKPSEGAREGLPDRLHSTISKSESAREVERELMEQGLMSVYDPQHQQQQQQQHQQYENDQSQRANMGERSASMVRKTLDVSDMRVFLMQPGPMNAPLQCHIRRDKGKGNRMYPRYSLYLTDGDRFLLSARKRKKSKSSNYIISLDEDDTSRNSGNFFGKLRSNFVGTEFWFYDKGMRKTGTHETTISPSQSSERTELGAVTYQYNVLGTRGPRKMTAMVPAMENEALQRPFVFRPSDKARQAILEAHKANIDTEKLVVMRNKPPKWNEQLGAYCLNFNGRVTHASVKNFQLVADSDKERVILQFGKVGKDFFTMDYVYPMSALQAFAICLTSFDNKLACE